MKVRALITFVDGPACQVRHEGEVWTVDPAVGSGWLRAGFVERMEPEVQAAVLSAPEAAVTRKGKR
jgi:hypothetical protein